MNFVENPNFPKGKASFVAVSEEASDVIDALNSARIGVIPIKPCENLPKGIASHSDLQVLHLGGNKIMTASCSEESSKMLSVLGFNIKNTDKELTEDYPNDCLLNLEILGKNVIMNPSGVDKKVLEYIYSMDMNIIGVKQGYSKCSVLAVCEDAIITADEKIAEAAADHEIEVLKIESGGIYLKGYDTGFIGGCGGMIEQKILGTSGSMKPLKDYENIKDFLRNRNIYMENLAGKELRDIGGILPLCEE